MTEKKCTEYFRRANSDANSKHFAIADENDEYIGTISLKNIDHEKKEAEYAISTRKKAHGTGTAAIATNEILKIAFEDLGLNRVYLNVLKENGRANAFYQKVGFQFDYCEKQAIEINENWKDLNWCFLEVTRNERHYPSRRIQNPPMSINKGKIEKPMIHFRCRY